MAKEYVELGAAIEAAIDAAEEWDGGYNPRRAANIRDRINCLPAADVVEVVRCRECMFWDTSWNPRVGVTGEAHYCPRCHLVTLKDSFCSGAWRKDGGQDE